MKKVDLSKFDNSFFKVGANFLKNSTWYFLNAIIFKSSFFPFYKLKIFLLKIFGSKIGNNVLIKPCVNIKYPWKLEIKNNVWIGENVWIDNLDFIKIGNNVCISQGAILLCGNHNFKKESFDLITGKIIIEDGVWIGAKSFVCPNVICFSHSVLSVNSVANKNLKAYTIYQGNPVKEVRERKIL